MAGDDAGYEVRSARAVRGMEARTITKWEKSGWEFVTQSRDSPMSSTLTFRRQKRKKPPLLWAVGGVGLVAIIVTAGIISERRDLPEEASAPPTASSTPADDAVPPSAKASTGPSEEANAAGQTEATESASAEPGPEEALTAETSQEFAALLAEPAPGGPRIEDFAAEHDGKLIEFDGNIAHMVNHGSFDT